MNSRFWKAKIFNKAEILNLGFSRAEILKSAKILNSGSLLAEVSHDEAKMKILES